MLFDFEELNKSTQESAEDPLPNNTEFEDFDFVGNTQDIQTQFSKWLILCRLISPAIDFVSNPGKRLKDSLSYLFLQRRDVFAAATKTPLDFLQ